MGLQSCIRLWHLNRKKVGKTALDSPLSKMFTQGVAGLTAAVFLPQAVLDTSSSGDLSVP